MMTLMETMTGLMMIMTLAQRKEVLLWTIVFALQVSAVVDKKLLKSFTFSQYSGKNCNSYQ